MQISTRGRYGLKAVIDIANAEDSETCRVSLKSIATRQGLSESYLEQIIAPLKKSGIVKSVRGAGGGYVLCRPSSEITVGDVLRALEGSLAPADCLNSKEITCGTNDCELCRTKQVFDRLFESVNEVVDSVTLKELKKD